MKHLLAWLLCACLLVSAGCAPSYIDVVDEGMTTTSTFPTSGVTTLPSSTTTSGGGVTTDPSGVTSDTAEGEMPTVGSTSSTTSNSSGHSSPSTSGTTPSTTKSTTSSTKPQPAPTADEHRALWVSTYANLDYPSDRTLSSATLKKECEKLVSRAKEIGITTLYFQVRPCGDALYESSYFPSSRYVVAKQGDPLPLDILDYMTATAHAAGLELYAWVNPVRIKAYASEVLAADNPAVKHPDWTISLSGGGLYYNLGLPEVRKLIADGVAEIVQNYDVDGVIFDDYFYPYGGISDAADADAYAAYGAGKTRDDFRRASVNQTLKACYDRIKALDTACRFGVSPFGIRLNSDAGTSGQQSYHTIYCDAVAWMSGGYVDFVAPQLYWSAAHPQAPYKPLAAWWASQAALYGVDFLPALAAYRYDSAQVSSDVFTSGEITRQITYSRELDGYAGCSLFRYYFLFEGAKGGVEDEILDLFT